MVSRKLIDVNEHSLPQRVWIDTAIGTSPDDATALLFACVHPKIEVVGVSISGKNQDRRAEEAHAVLEQGRCGDVSVFHGDNVTRADIGVAEPQHTVALGPLTNIARLALDEAPFGKLHVRGGAFREVHYRGTTITAEEVFAADLDSTRVVLTQCDDISISAFEASSALVLDGHTRSHIEENYPFLKNRYDGFVDYLIDKHGQDHSEILLNAMLPFCDILNTPTITREVIEFYIQPDGSLRRAYEIPHRPLSIPEVTENPDRVPVPLVKHDVVRSIEPSKVLDELLGVL